MTKCAKCGVEISLATRINYNNHYMCPRCVYKVAPPGSPVRWQMELNYPEYLKPRG